MKSPMLTSMPQLEAMSKADLFMGVRGAYTELQVLKSAAGFYIGTMWEEFDAEGKRVWQEPGGRDSGYYPTREDAEKALKLIETFGTGTRDHP